MFPYDWLDNYEKLSHVGPVGYQDFYSSFKPTITKDKCKQFLKMFQANDCATVGDWLRVYNFADVGHLMRLLGIWPSNTILIKLMYAKTQLVSHVYQ